jgi:hypothetical protein
MIPGTWQTRDNIYNDYNINRVAQRNFTYSGIQAFPMQDIALIEQQWGPIADRTQEHLTSMDYQIIKVRRRLLAGARAMAEGIEPEAPWHPEEYRWHREQVMVQDGTLAEAGEKAKARAGEQRTGAAVEKLAPTAMARAR